MLTLRRVSDLYQPEDGFEATIVNVPFGPQVPTFNGHHHTRQDVLARRVVDGPGVRTVTRHVSQHACGIVADLLQNTTLELNNMFRSIVDNSLKVNHHVEIE